MRCTWCDRAGHQVTPGHRASASMQPVEAVMVTAHLVAMRCTWCDRVGLPLWQPIAGNGAGFHVCLEFLFHK